MVGILLIILEMDDANRNARLNFSESRNPHFCLRNCFKVGWSIDVDDPPEVEDTVDDCNLVSDHCQHSLIFAERKRAAPPHVHPDAAGMFIMKPSAIALMMQMIASIVSTLIFMISSFRLTTRL